MWNDSFNKLPVGTSQASKRNILVPDLHLATFAEQALDQLNLWALSQIIRASLEAESEQGNFLPAGIQYDFYCTVDMLNVTREQRSQQRQIKVQFLGAVRDRPQIFGQA